MSQLLNLIYFRLERVCLFSSARLSPAPLADDVSEDNAELRRNLPPSPGAATCSASTIPRPQPCTVNFQSAARVQSPADTRHNAAICSAHLPASSGPGQWQHPHNVTQWPVSCVPVLPLCVSSVISQLDRIKKENPSWAHSTDTGLLPGTAGLPALFLGFMG